MSDTHFLTAARTMIEAAKARQLQPMAFMMNATTQRIIADQMETEVCIRMSIAQRVKRRLSGKRETAERICGLAVIVVPGLPDGTMNLQSSGPEPQPGSVNQPGGVMGGQPAQWTGTQQQQSPFAQREPAAEPAADMAAERVPTLADMSQATESKVPTCSDILIKAMDGVDALERIVVIRVYKDTRIDMCTNAPSSFELQGIIQKASVWLMQQGF